MSKKKTEIEVDDRIDSILRESLMFAVRQGYGPQTSEQETRVLDRVVALVAVDNNWIEFKDQLKSKVQNEASKVLQEFKEDHVRMSEAAARERDRYQQLSDEKERLIQQWNDSSSLLRDVRMMMQLVNENFQNATSKKELEIIQECHRTILLKYIELMHHYPTPPEDMPRRVMAPTRAAPQVRVVGQSSDAPFDRDDFDLPI